jgi:hypothetical protein
MLDCGALWQRSRCLLETPEVTSTRLDREESINRSHSTVNKLSYLQHLDFLWVILVILTPGF